MLLREQPSLYWRPKPTKIYGLDSYPPTAESLAETIHFMIDKSLELLDASLEPASTITCYVTDDHKSPFTALSLKQYDDVEAVVLLYENLPDDAVYYMSAHLRADAFVRKLDMRDGRDVFALWDRCSGLSTLATRQDTKLELIAPEASSEILPLSVRARVGIGSALH